MKATRNAPMVRRRRLQRGAALVEAVIVSGLLMTMMAGGLFLHRLYVAQHDALGEARLAAWSQALAGCNSGIDLNAVWRQAGESGEPVDIETTSAPGFFGAVGHTSASASKNARADARVGGGSYTLNASDTVACNEIAQSERGDVASLLGYITANVVPSFF